MNSLSKLVCYILILNTVCCQFKEIPDFSIFNIQIRRRFKCLYEVKYFLLTLFLRENIDVHSVLKINCLYLLTSNLTSHQIIIPIYCQPASTFFLLLFHIIHYIVKCNNVLGINDLFLRVVLAFHPNVGWSILYNGPFESSGDIKFVKYTVVVLSAFSDLSLN